MFNTGVGNKRSCNRYRMFLLSTNCRKIPEADNLTDYAVEIRYPDDWYEHTIEETKQASEIALKVKFFKVIQIRVQDV